MTPVYLTDSDADEYLYWLESRGYSLSLEGNRLSLDGPFTDDDRETITAYAVPLANALRRRENRSRPPESNEPPPAQPETQAPAPPAPEVRFRGRPITETEIRRCLSGSGDLERYLEGSLSRSDALEMTRCYLKQSAELFGI